MAQPFDFRKLALNGEPVPIASSIRSNPLVGRAFFDVSRTGVVVYRGGDTTQFQLTWFDAQGGRTAIGRPAELYHSPAVSPDGTRVAVSRLGSQRNRNIWVLDTSRGTSTRLTFDPATGDFPVWSPDGARIAFASNRSGHWDLYVKTSDGSGEDQLLLKTDGDKAPESWSGDGRYLLYESGSAQQDIWVLPLEGPDGAHGKPFPFLRTKFDEGEGQFSPGAGRAARWIAYDSDESGTYEVYVQPFSPDSGGGSVASGGKWTVSSGGGRLPALAGRRQAALLSKPDGDSNGSGCDFRTAVSDQCPRAPI